MNKNIYIVGALMFAMVGLPVAAVHAQDAMMGGTEATDTNTGSAAPSVMGTQARPLEQAKQQMEQAREQVKQQVEQVSVEAKQTMDQARATVQEARGGLMASSTGAALQEQAKQQVEQVREQAKQQVEQVREMVKNRIELIRESTTTPAQSIEQLKQMIENRAATIQDEAASSTPENRKILEDVAPMRVAVHALLAARDVLGTKGGIGQQVSDIAQQMNDSVATTTNAVAQIQSRGFFTKLFFGGDKTAADTITQQIDQNQTHIQALAGLIASASTTPEVKTTLDAQVKAMTDEQSRLQDIAQGQSKLWGLFSWRLF